MSANTISISPARPQDAEGIAAVQHDTWLATYPNEKLGITLAAIKERLSRDQPVERIAKWRNIIGNLEEYVTVAKDGPNIIGFSCAKKGDTANHIAAIYILPQYHGTGVAQKLMDAAMNWLGDEQDIIVEVASYNDRAIRFYQKYDFAPTGETGNSGVIPTMLMRRNAPGRK